MERMRRLYSPTVRSHLVLVEMDDSESGPVSKLERSKCPSADLNAWWGLDKRQSNPLKSLSYTPYFDSPHEKDQQKQTHTV